MELSFDTLETTGWTKVIAVIVASAGIFVVDKSKKKKCLAIL